MEKKKTKVFLMLYYGDESFSKRLEFFLFDTMKVTHENKKRNSDRLETLDSDKNLCG